MKIFLKKFFVFCSILFFVSSIATLLPATPKTSKSLLFALKDKDQLLNQTKKKRIIFIGGSNLSFGLNSQLLKDSLHLNPINTAIHAGIGLKFMINHSKSFVESNDIIVLVPEYTQYFDNTANGAEALFRLIFDVNLSGISQLDYAQIKQIVQFFPKFVISKFNPSEYTVENNNELRIYDRSSFNEFGDAVAHWGDTVKTFEIENLNDRKLNNDVFLMIQEFSNYVKFKNARLFVSFPCYDQNSFIKNSSEINLIYKNLLKTEVSLLGSPEQFSLMQQYNYNSPYHLTFLGANKRTTLLIKLIKEELGK
jgi:hypothetical protein